MPFHAGYCDWEMSWQRQILPLTPVCGKSSPDRPDPSPRRLSANNKSDENYKSLRNQKDKRLLHYFNAFSKLNACLLGQYEIKQYQYSFFNEYLIYDDPDIINMLGSDLTKMLRDFNEEIKRFVLVCFSQREDKVEKIYAEVPVYGFRTVYTELWNYVLSAEYDTMTNDKDHNIYYDDSEINISLRDEEYADEPNLEMKEVGQAQENI